MSRLRFGVLLAALAALTVTSIAVADEDKPTTRKPVAAHFTATGSVKTTSCLVTNTPNKTSGTAPAQTTAGVLRHANLSGTSTSADSRLNGPLRMTIRFSIGPNGFGVATGTFRVVNKIEASLVASVSGTNRLDGFLRGQKGKRLFANFSATISGTTLTGDLGSGTHQNTAVIGRGGCGD